MWQRDSGFFEEQDLGKAYDLRLLARLGPFLAPYRLLIALSVVLVVLITLVDLALPYITKVAIDRHIVPRAGEPGEAGDTPADRRLFEAALSDPEVARVVARHPDRFTVRDGTAAIPWSALSALEPGELEVLRRADRRGLGRLTLLFLVLIGMHLLLNFFQKLVMETAGHRIMHDLRMAVFDRIQSRSLAFFNRNPVGRLVTRATNDVQNMHEFFTSVLSLLFKDIFLLVGIMGLLLTLNWRLTLAAFTVLPLVVYSAMRFSRRVRDVFRRLRVQVAAINTRFAETLEGVRVLQVFRREGDNAARFAELNHANYLAGMEHIHLMAVFMPLIEVLGFAAVAVIIYYGGLQVLSAELTLGALVAFISYLRMFFRPIRDLSEKYNVLQNALSSAERIFQILDSEEAMPAPAAGTARAGGGAGEAVVFENVGFHYVPGEPVLENVSFRAAPGETVALVGPTGAGKTSIIHLIIRFYLPTAGRIRIGGVDIRDLSPDDLRSRMALVMQDPFLFSGTVRDNIFPPHLPVDPGTVERVLEAANCRQLVARLPDGLNTRLSEGGKTLSSGERQLLSIARAFARDPSILLLDEATSYIDSATEAKIQEALARLMAGRTAFVAAHRLSTIRSADQILVLRDGRLVERGDHAALLAGQGFYARLLAFQG